MSVVTKVELVSKIAEETQLPKASVEKFLDAAAKAVNTFLLEGKDVPILGVGKLKPKDVAARNQKNPKGETITVAAHKTVKFTASKAVKDLLNK